MRSYAEAQKVVRTARDKVSKRIKRNTYVEDLGDRFAVRLYWTHVVTYYPDGSVVLDSNGWRTRMTKERINDHLPNGWYICQEGGVWYLRKDMGLKEYIFHNGIRIGPRGGCDGKLRPKKKERKKESKLHPIGGWNPIEL